MSIANPSLTGVIFGAGSPNYLDGATSVKVVTISATEYAVVASRLDGGDALTIIDISTPASPSLTGVISGAGSPNYLNGANAVDVITIGVTEYAVVASRFDNSVTIIDISTPASPSLTGVILGAGSPNYLGFPINVRTVTIGGTEYAVVTSLSDDALTIIDISTPASPSLTGVISGAGSPNYLDGAWGLDIITIDVTEYAVVGARNDNSVTIIDISTPASPSFTGVISGAGSPNYLDYLYSVFVIVIGGTEYAIATSYLDNSVTIIDISIPASPSLTSVILGAGSPNYLEGAANVKVVALEGTEYAFVTSTIEDALTIFDVSSPASPSHVSVISGIGSPNHLDEAYGLDIVTIGSSVYAFVASVTDDSLSIFDVTAPPPSPSVAIATQGWANLAGKYLSGNLL